MSTLVKRVLPKAPQTEDYRGQRRTFEFFTHTVDSTDGNTQSVELDMDVNFVGIVQLKDSPVFRAVFFRSSTPFDKAMSEYDQRLQELINEAQAEGVVIQSMEDLEAWAQGDEKPADNIIDMSAVLAALKEERGQ